MPVVHADRIGYRQAELLELSTRIASLERQVEALTSKLEPLRRRRAQLMRTREAIESRTGAGFSRRESVVAALKDIEKANDGKRPKGWLVKLAQTVGMSTRHMRRVLKAADVSIPDIGSQRREALNAALADIEHAHGDGLPDDWLEKLAAHMRLSTGYVRRMMKAADIIVTRD